ASKRLHDAGIELETDFVWRLGVDGWKLLTKDWVRDMMSNTYESIPAPSMVEVWRELPEDTMLSKVRNEGSSEIYAEAYVESWDDYGYQPSLKESTNPADALAELLIWVREEKVGMIKKNYKAYEKPGKV
ncbi:MAG: hypothetical protein PHU71_07120, partial [Candidatus Gracilibacteria bacterium]|nr:hypothetical protein [Candidatus Gracilibacteria bacterium]